jgi:MFS family permease
MDSSVLGVAVPSLTAHFHTIRDIGWYSSGYRLSSCSFQFVFGKLYKLYPVKRVFLVSMATFVVGSILSATAQTSEAFVFARAVCGLASAGV